MLPSERATEVVKARGMVYGHPSVVYEVAEAMYQPIAEYLRGKPGEGTAVFQICIKIARECVGQHSDDNLIDICGYTNVWAMIQDSRKPVASRKVTDGSR